MTYDPDRDAKAPADMNPNVRPTDRKGGMGAAMWIVILSVLAVISFAMFGMGRDNTVATDQRPAITTPNTTGSGGTAPAARDGLPNSTAVPGVTPSTVPAPSR